jgi:pimeloyl-ACP methyl ester carboxylesterase
METLIKIGLILSAIIFISVLLIKRFLYFNPSSEYIEPRETYQVLQQGHISAWFLKNDVSDKVILYCHGNSGNISTRENKILKLRDLGCSVLIFDYSGYGNSSGVPNEQQCYDDASIMIAMLLQNYNAQNIILYGQSLGCPVATYVAIKYDIPVLVLESPLPSIKYFIHHKFPSLSFLSFLFPEFDTNKYIKSYKGKSLMLHSNVDEIIPIISTLELQQNVTQFIPMYGSHNNPKIPWDKIKNFIH